MQTVASHCVTMHPTAKLALQKRILAAIVQAEAFQRHLSQCFGDRDPKDRMAALAKHAGKEDRATVLKECEIQSTSWNGRKQKKLLGLFCTLLRLHEKEPTSPSHGSWRTRQEAVC